MLYPFGRENTSGSKFVFVSKLSLCNLVGWGIFCYIKSVCDNHGRTYNVWVVERRLRVYTDGYLQRQADISLPVLDIISETLLFSQRVGPEPGILAGSSVVHPAEYQGTEPRPIGEACKDDSLHDPSWLN